MDAAMIIQLVILLLQRGPNGEPSLFEEFVKAIRVLIEVATPEQKEVIKKGGASLLAKTFGSL